MKFKNVKFSGTPFLYGLVTTRSIVNDTLPVTRVGASPLIAAPAHEWSTLLTVLKQAQGINVKVVGANRKTVVSLDMGLYLPAKKLQMARDDLKHIILRPGALHILMAQLRTIGAFIENSGIDMAWMESDLRSIWSQYCQADPRGKPCEER